MHIFELPMTEEVIRWEHLGRPVPPPQVYKQAVIRYFAKKHDIDIFVETGTLHGDTVEAIKDVFHTIYSIELSEVLYRNALARFVGEDSIKLLHGDSGSLLPELLTKITSPCVLWLDSHYTEIPFAALGAQFTPIVAELHAVLDHPLVDQHVILIDDARLFQGHYDFPTVKQIRDFIACKRPDLHFEVLYDIMQIYKKH